MSTQSQITANQRNSQLSTGPRTASGKKRACLNALRHGLLSQVVVLPGEDMNAFQLFGRTFQDDLHPSGPVEHQLVNTLITTQWRLNRFCAHETNLFALGHQENSNVIDVDDETIHAALTAAATLRANLDSIKTLGLHEQRLHKLFNSTLKTFLQLRADRLSRENRTFDQDEVIHKHHKRIAEPYDPSKFGFVPSNDQMALRKMVQEALNTAYRYIPPETDPTDDNPYRR
jgi:hypothetical protein